ncbi:uncharacterized protein LOC108672011 [Hyalella azteca]|uniref:Uncharacterized protein LOC108672011 n=1 Tax=Hyalella azteca TaxID=294128 RepID=A0A979FTQ5_HYAAZ|nr:uncharacterized protein LOC108672011 [Hyalella azteca]
MSALDALERLMELSIAVIGRPHAMLDLAVTLLECGHLDKAVQILKDEDVTLESERVQYLCKLYVSTRQLQHLQQLCSLARSAACEARDVLLIQAHLYAYYQLAGESQLAKALLTQLQAQNVTETDLISMVPPLPAHLWRDKRVTNVPRLSNSSDTQAHEEKYTDFNHDNDIKSKQQSEFREEGRTKPDSYKVSRSHRRGNEDRSVNAPEFLDENHRESNRQFSSSTFSPRGQNKLSQLQNTSPIEQDEPSREWDYDAPPYERELCQSMRSFGSRYFPPFNEEQEKTKNNRRFSNSRPVLRDCTVQFCVIVPCSSV